MDNGPTLRRDTAAAAGESHDLIVIGGGIYGAMVTLGAARRGLRPLLLERDDFGGATSWNSHRIVHGGLRYLQRLDLPRFFTSVRERRWFLRHFPDLVRPLPCLMPLYGEGARRPEIMRLALMINHALSRHRNDGVRPDCRLESGGVMTRSETLALFPGARPEGLRGGALWYDAVMTDSQRLLIEVLRWACACGARALNYVEATTLTVAGGRVTGVEAYDRVAEAPLALRAPAVINCAGPWSATLARALAGEVDGLFRPSLAFNLLFERPAPSEVAVAVSAPGRGTHTWFLYPRAGLLYAGTAHHPWTGDEPTPRVDKKQIDEAIEQINAAVPRLELRRHQVLRVYAGLLPATRPDGAELSDRPVIHDHGRDDGGPAGLVSVSGVKFTTARDVAERALRRALPALPPVGSDSVRPAAAELPSLVVNDYGELPEPAAEALRRFAADEAVVHTEDLLLRRGAWADDPRRLQGVEDAVRAALRRRA
jgi:glycerol-3-phosphate dehydrogenase